MDYLDKIAQSHVYMLESHKAFLDLIEELKDDRNTQSSGDEYHSEAPMSQYDNYSEQLEESEMLLADEDNEEMEGVFEPSSQDFPMSRKAFDYRTVNFDDPAFWGGKEIGIPMGLLVHSEEGQGKLLPIRNGMFVDYDGEI